MASSSVIRTGPGRACPNAASANTMPVKTAHVTQTARIRMTTFACLAFKGLLRLGELVSLSRDPDVKRRQENNAQQQIGNQAADDDDGERPLRIGPDVMR